MKPVFSLVFMLSALFTAAKPENYILYHRMITEAETALVQEDFSSALLGYKKAFSVYAYKFPADLYHAFQVAAMLKSEKDCADLLDSCLAYGIPLKCLKETAVLQKYLRSIPGDELTMKSGLFEKIYKAKTDTVLHNEWKERFLCEQSAKQNPDNQEPFMNCLRDNYTALKNYILTNKQFPGEKIIGVSQGPDVVPAAIPRRDSVHVNTNEKGEVIRGEIMFADTGDADVCDLSNSLVTATLLHTGISFVELKTYLDLSLENGSLNPRDYMYFLEFEKTTGKRQVGFLKYYSDHQDNLDFSPYILCFNMGWGEGCRNNGYANECRKKIGVCTVETDMLKYEMEKKYGFVFLNII